MNLPNYQTTALQVGDYDGVHWSAESLGEFIMMVTIYIPNMEYRNVKHLKNFDGFGTRIPEYITYSFRTLDAWGCTGYLTYNIKMHKCPEEKMLEVLRVAFSRVIQGRIPNPK